MNGHRDRLFATHHRRISIKLSRTVFSGKVLEGASSRQFLAVHRSITDPQHFLHYFRFPGLHFSVEVFDDAPVASSIPTASPSVGAGQGAESISEVCEC